MGKDILGICRSELTDATAEVYFNRGLAYLKLGNKQQAVADLSKAGELGLYDAYSIIKQQQK